MRELPLGNNQVVLLDDNDYVELCEYRWTPNHGYNTTYACRTMRDENGDFKIQSMHRYLMGNPKGMEVDHIDGNGLNNQRSNLRIVTHKENCNNRHAIHWRAKKRNTTIRTWWSHEEEDRILEKLNEKGIGRSVSDRVRMGIYELATKHGIPFEKTDVVS